MYTTMITFLYINQFSSSSVRHVQSSFELLELTKICALAMGLLLTLQTEIVVESDFWLQVELKNKNDTM